MWCVYAVFPRGKAGVVYSASSWFESPAVFAGYDISLLLDAVRIHIHLPCAHQRPERSHDTNQPKYNILCTCKAQSYQNNLHKVLYRKAHARTHAPTKPPTHPPTNTHSLTLSDCSRNWVLILAGAEILWDFIRQFLFSRFIFLLTATCEHCTFNYILFVNWWVERGIRLGGWLLAFL